MKSVTKTYDLNAHIEDIKCNITTENGSSVSIISFTNLGYGDITAIKFNAIGYNSFGDIVPVGDKENFFLIIQDIMVKKNEKAENLKAKLPVFDIRKLELEEAQICYADGSVVTYEGKYERKIELNEFDASEKNNIEAVHKLYEKRIKYQVSEFEDGWVCGCGRFNRKDAPSCTLCGKEKLKTEQALCPEGLKKLVEEYLIRINEDRKKVKQDKIKITIASIIALLVCIFVGNAIIMSGRSTYSSEKEMKEALQGIYTYYKDNKAYMQIEIHNDQFRYIYDLLGYGDWIDIDWYPNKGKFHTFEDIIITKNGELKVDKKLFQKGGTLSTKDVRDNLHEDGNSVLKITVDSLNSNSSYTICTGKVKNSGQKTYSFVKVKGAFKDSTENVVDTDWTYAVGSEGLAPGESSTFRLSVPKDYDIESCIVSILDFN